MKRLNIIIIAEEGAPAAQDIFQSAGFEEGLNVLNSLLGENPTLANDPAVAELLKTSDLLKAEDVANGNAPVVDDTPTTENVNDEPKETKQVKEKSPLAGLPFFKDEDGTPAPTADDLKSLTPDNFHEFAAKLGIDATKEGWVGEAVAKLASQSSPQNNEFEKQYTELRESIELLPKEVQTIVNLALENKDWKTAVVGAASIDLSKDFNSLSADEKIKAHNYYFPEDVIAVGEDITKKDVSKSLKAAEAKYASDKFISNEQVTKANNEKIEGRKAFVASVDASIAELKKEYPDFNDKELKSMEEIVKKGGIYNQFFDNKGNLTKDGFKKLVFALNGEKILKVATSIAENRGKSKGKSEVLSVEQGVDKKNNNGGTELTNVEKSTAKFIGESMVGSQLTY